MKKLNLFTVAICIFCFQGCLSNSRNNTELPIEKSTNINLKKSQDYSQEHIKFIVNFYNEYVGNWDNFDINDEVILKKYCTKSLIENIAKKTLSELSYDPFIYAQDIWTGVLEFLEVEKVKEGINKYIVSYRYNEKDERTRIRLEIINTEDGFKINGVGGFYSPINPQEDIFIRGN